MRVGAASTGSDTARTGAGALGSFTATHLTAPLSGTVSSTDFSVSASEVALSSVVGGFELSVASEESEVDVLEVSDVSDWEGGSATTTGTTATGTA